MFFKNSIPKNINIIYLKPQKIIYKFIPFKILKKIKKYEIKKTYDIVIDFNSYNSSVALAAINTLANTHIMWIHNDVIRERNNNFKYKILHFFFKSKYIYFDTFVGVSKGVIEPFKKLNKIKNKNDNLKNKTKEIRNMLDNLKSKGLIKNQLVLDVVDRDKAIVFIDLIDRTIAEYENIQELTVTLKELESELLNNRDRIRLLLKNNEDFNFEVDNLKDKIQSKNEEINNLKEENHSLKSSLQHFKNLIYNLVKFLMDRIYRNKDKEKYMEFAKELYEHGALEENDFKLLQDKKNLDNDKKLEIEKDDIER